MLGSEWPALSVTPAEPECRPRRAFRVLRDAYRLVWRNEREWMHLHMGEYLRRREERACMALANGFRVMCLLHRHALLETSLDEAVTRLRRVRRGLHDMADEVAYIDLRLVGVKRAGRRGYEGVQGVYTRPAPAGPGW